MNSPSTDTGRRSFLGGMAALAQSRSGDIIYRELGKTGEKVSAIGRGGHHIGRPKDKAEGITRHSP